MHEKIATKNPLHPTILNGQGSFRMLGKTLQIKHTLIYKWIRDFGKNLPEPKMPNNIKEIEFDKIWHFVGSEKTNFGSLKQLITAHVELLPMSWTDEILQHLDDTAKRSNI
jgi:hypothetical protein